MKSTTNLEQVPSNSKIEINEEFFLFIITVGKN